MLIEEPSTAQNPQVPRKGRRAQTFDVIVPEGQIWVMGDNRNHSADSRAHMENNGGFINLTDVEGKAAVIAWPLNRMNVLNNFPEVFERVPTP